MSQIIPSKFWLLITFVGRPTKHTDIKMKKVIAAFNMTLDGICDHTTGVADEGLHQHYSDLVDNAGVILYGRTTYQLMQFWQHYCKILQVKNQWTTLQFQ